MQVSERVVEEGGAQRVPRLAVVISFAGHAAARNQFVNACNLDRLSNHAAAIALLGC